MKKTGIVFLLSILFLQAGGLMLFYEFHRYKMQYDLLHVQEKGGFQKMTLTLFEFQQSRINDHEFSYKGKMYDFKAAVTKGNCVELLAMQDIKEDGIVRLIEIFNGNESKQNGELTHKLSKLLTLTYLSTESVACIVLSEYTEIKNHTIFGNLICFSPSVPSPPPDRF